MNFFEFSLLLVLNYRRINYVYRLVAAKTNGNQWLYTAVFWEAGH